MGDFCSTGFQVILAISAGNHQYSLASASFSRLHDKGFVMFEKGFQLPNMSLGFDYPNEFRNGNIRLPGKDRSGSYVTSLRVQIALFEKGLYLFLGNIHGRFHLIYHSKVGMCMCLTKFIFNLLVKSFTGKGNFV